MNIQKQNGFVSTLNLVPYLETSECAELRKFILKQAKQKSNYSPNNQIDEFNESILTFEDHFQALSFMAHAFRIAVGLGKDSSVNFELKSSLCNGEYFIHRNEIYGEAVNLATRLSCSSRSNELLVCGIDRLIIEEFVTSQEDLAYSIRNKDMNCVAIHLLDDDSTDVIAENTVLQIKFNNHTEAFTSARNKLISIGRADDSDIIIDRDCISRHHATIAINYGNIFIEDHSTNGTYLYFDHREIFLTGDSMKLTSNGYISCGRTRQSSKSMTDIISYILGGESSFLDKRKIA